MKKLFQYTILLFIFLFAASSQSITNAQELNEIDQENINVEIIKDTSSLESEYNNNRNFYYYHVYGDVDEISSTAETISLVLKKNDGPKKLLCSYAGGLGRTYDFPACLGRDLVTSDFLTESGNYKFYFTLSGIDGSPVSRVVSLATPVPSFLVPNDDTDEDVDVDNTESEEDDSQSEDTSQTSDSSYGELDGGLVSTDCGYGLAPGKGGRMCVFSDLMSLIARVIDYIFVLILPIAAIIFAYAGYLYITSGGNAEKRTAAKKAMTYLVVGIVVIMMAWLLVKTVLVSLGVTAGFTLFLDI